MAHFTLSKFKKAGQLAFLYLFVLFLFSCGGGGGGTSSPIPPTEISSGYAYTSFADWSSALAKFDNDCETANANRLIYHFKYFLIRSISFWS